VGLEPKLVKRWVRWWNVVEAVVKAIKTEAIVYQSGWLTQLLVEFRYWKGRVACEPWPLQKHPALKPQLKPSLLRAKFVFRARRGALSAAKALVIDLGLPNQMTFLAGQFAEALQKALEGSLADLPQAPFTKPSQQPTTDLLVYSRSPIRRTLRLSTKTERRRRE